MHGLPARRLPSIRRRKSRPKSGGADAMLQTPIFQRRVPKPHNKKCTFDFLVSPPGDFPRRLPLFLLIIQMKGNEGSTEALPVGSKFVCMSSFFLAISSPVWIYTSPSLPLSLISCPCLGSWPLSGSFLSISPLNSKGCVPFLLLFLFLYLPVLTI
jgi:hypothetical protein